MICSSIIQGCPCSGSLFAIAADFLIRGLAAEVTEDLWAFADDIAILIDSIDRIQSVESLFEWFANASGLHLNATQMLHYPTRRPLH